MRCIKVKISNIFSVKLGGYVFLQNKDVYVLEKSFKMKFKIFIWKNYENNNNGFKKKEVLKTSLLKCIILQDSNKFSIKFNKVCFLKILKMCTF